jgi:hypothetical protein
MILVFFFALITALIIGLLLIKIKIQILLDQNKKSEVIVRIVLFKVIKIKMRLFLEIDISDLQLKITLAKKNKRNIILYDSNKKKKEEKKKNTTQYLPLLKKIEWHRLNTTIDFGLIDAFKTAMVAGNINLLFDCILSIIKTFNPNSEIRFKLNPHYNYPVFKMRTNCIISFRLVNIIYEFTKVKSKQK